MGKSRLDKNEQKPEKVPKNRRGECVVVNIKRERMRGLTVAGTEGIKSQQARTSSRGLVPENETRVRKSARDPRDFDS